MANLWLTIITLMFVGGIVLRVWQRRLRPIRLQKVSMPVALSLVGEFLESCYDGQFGFPSGLFQVEQSGGSQVVAQEITSRASHFTTILVRFYRAVFGFTAAFGLFGFVFGLVLAVFLTPLLLYAALTEVALRYLLRSKIVADFESTGDSTTVLFTLRGPVAQLVGRRLEKAFQTPSLPPRVAALAGVPHSAPA